MPDSSFFVSIGTALAALVKIVILLADLAFFIHLVLRLIAVTVRSSTRSLAEPAM